MTVAGARKPVYCTNPIAFAAPLDEGPPLLIDQASSATAFVQLRHYAERGETLPAGWAVDGDGQPTTDPHAALRGALLAFGGVRGANIALMVEVMAAGLAGANWALDAPSFTSGDRSPGAGLLVIAITPALLAPTFRGASNSSSTGSPSLAFIFPDDAPPRPKSNCPTCSQPRSSAPSAA